MPGKPTSSHKTSSGDEPPVEAPEKEVLDLLEKPKRRRRKVEEPAPPPPPKPSVLEEQKKNALSLFDEDERRQNKVRVKRAPGTSPGGLPPISRLNRLGEPLPAPVPLAPLPVPALEIAPETAAEVSGAELEAEPTDEKVIQIKPPIIVKDLAERLGLKTFQVIKDLIAFEVFATPDKAIEPDVAAQVCEKHGFTFEKEKREKGGGVHTPTEVVVVEPPPPVAEPKDVMQPRAPIITIMGHVDHGKTSLLDAIRNTKVVSGEAGGITQHIRAYSVTHEGHPITFIDTPGHAAFTEMRARGANVTDVVVLVVAANDGFMPQTIEALNHAKAAKVHIVVAINKIDLPSANAMRVRTQMQEQGIPPVEWGGNTEVVEVSALKGIGIDKLLEHLALEAEILDLKANPDAKARATVIESRLEPGRGATVTAIVTHGTLKPGIPFICGPHSGKIKSLLDDRGERILEALPGTPVEILGFAGQPNVGDEVVEMSSERDARKLSEDRQEEIRQKKLSAPKRSQLDKLFAGIEDGHRKNLRLVIKTDVQGSAEAIVHSLKEIKTDKVDLDILHSASGAITESDILLASASDAIVIGFNTKLDSKAVSVAKREGVQIKLFSIIYELLDQVKEAMLGLLDPELRETVLGHAKVKAVFKINKGRVAGCLVTDGRVERKSRARLIRDKQPIYDGGFDTLRRFNDNVDEVRNGLECGIKLGDYNDYQEGDIIECYQLDKIAQTL